MSSRSRKYRRHHSDSDSDEFSDDARERKAERRERKREEETRKRRRRKEREKRRSKRRSDDDDDDGGDSSGYDDDDDRYERRRRRTDRDERRRRRRKKRETRENKKSREGGLLPSIDDLLPSAPSLRSSAYIVIEKLLTMYPESLMDLRELFQSLDELQTVDLQDLEDETVKLLLCHLFDHCWQDRVECVDQGRLSYRRIKAAGGQGHSSEQLAQLYDDMCTKMLDSIRGGDARDGGGRATAREHSDVKNNGEEGEEAELRRSIARYNERYRPKSLLDEHREGKRIRRAASKDPAFKNEKEAVEHSLSKVGYLTFDRERDVEKYVHKMDSQKMDRLVSSAKELNSRFDSRIQTSFL